MPARGKSKALTEGSLAALAKRTKGPDVADDTITAGPSKRKRVCSSCKKSDKDRPWVIGVPDFCFLHLLLSEKVSPMLPDAAMRMRVMETRISTQRLSLTPLN